MNLLSDDGIHKGHRERMRKKFILHSGRPFDSYELLEMLLYGVIPYKDTNPIAKKLLAAFGGLDGVFEASIEELVQVPGIGQRAAELIKAAGELCVAGESDIRTDTHKFKTDKEIGDFFIDYFAYKNANKMVAAMCFDNQMNLIAVKDFYDLDFGQAGVRAAPFVEFALKCRASCIATAHIHPYGPLFPTESDVVTNNMISEALKNVGVATVEHFIVTGKKHVGIMHNLHSALAQSAPDSDDFIHNGGEISKGEK